ncbi:Tyrosine-protein phosphatase YwqE [Aquimarina amphilecti]|uniref:protein-tyrosine-phosphatase n=1 Tax=Aquimarina amphilecti TaxID=1038014 RepID=A0A1H7HS55_AQUAM|nr:CpsB/CapC family capsule biosynthesis tyrosine phosphatase [Aquimarina amphilecti]SEK52517.1 Tyrosine-protein phosphatase YwqE [Aquimarina amphilecti]
MHFLSKKEIHLKEIIPQGYVDIHSHLLPNIDDGVKTVYQSAYIIEQFTNLGVKKIITTPHVMQEVWPNTTETIKSKHLEMERILSSLDIDVVLEASAEYMLDDLFYKRIKEKDIIALYEKYVLVEMSTFSAPINLNELLFEIKLAGFSPILAHPERYSFYQDHMEKYTELKESGFLFQLNLLSISGFYGEKVKDKAIKLLTEGFYDFAGSDVHNYHQFAILEKGFLPKNADKISALMKKNLSFS